MTPENIAKLRRILEGAATARIRSLDLLAEAELLIAGEGAPEAERESAERVLANWVDDWGPGECAEGLGEADVTAVLEDIASELEHRREMAVLLAQEDSV